MLYRSSWLGIFVLALACGRSTRDPDEHGAPVAGAGRSGGGVGMVAAGASTGGTAQQSGGQAQVGGRGVEAEAGAGSNDGQGGAAPAEPDGGEPSTGGEVDVFGHDDLVIRSYGMGEYEGLTVFATFDHNFGDPSRSDARSGVVTNGAFELRWVQGFDRDSFGAYAVLFVDYGGDASCTADTDPAWMTFVGETTPEGEPVVHTFIPVQMDSNHGPITCDEFNHWFDEPFQAP